MYYLCNFNSISFSNLINNLICLVISSTTEMEAAVPLFLIILPQLYFLHQLALSFIPGIGEDEVLSCMVVCSANDKLQHLPITLKNDTCVLLLILVRVLQQVLKTREQIFPHFFTLLQVCLCLQDLL